ncbi:MAG: hypothetical protein N3C12_10315 [Candidatus Binatia bacterium]|nr:hypothetical protein [Candidatus Binatia bacterium]
MDILELEPLDVFSIRSARPFDVGGVVHADFVWPPPAWTVVGALRGVLAELLGLPAVEYGRAGSNHPRFANVVDRIGKPDGPAKFVIGPALVLDVETQSLRWPVPADVFAVREGTLKLRRLRATLLPRECQCNFKQGRTCVLAPPSDLSAHPEKSLPLRAFDSGLLLEWLSGKETLELGARSAQDSSPDFFTEPRIGICMDSTANTVREGLFYMRSAVQLALGRSLAVPLLDRGDGLPWEALQGQVARFGADGHLVRLRPPRPFNLPPAPGDRPLKRARILCAAPIHPGDLDNIEVEGHQVRVLAVAAGKPVRIGGWRLLTVRRNGAEVEQGPRTLRTYYPAGTVLYVESDGDLRKLHGQNLAQCEEERAAGFGFALVGQWPEQV